MKKFLVYLLACLLFAGVSSVLYASRPKPKAETVTYEVSMHCNNCVKKLTDNLSLLRGVKDFKISLEEKTVIITYDPAKVSEERFEEIIQKLGYTLKKR